MMQLKNEKNRKTTTLIECCKITFKILFLSLILNSCKQESKPLKIIESIKKNNNQTQKTNNNQILIDFLDKNYLTNYAINIDGSNQSEHPIINYLNCENEGYFTVHFIPKSDSLRFFWKDKYLKIYKYEYDNTEIENRNISSLLKNNFHLYNIFSYKIDKEFIANKKYCTIESVYTNKNCNANIYLLDQTNNNWNLIKNVKSQMLPPYQDNNYFLNYFPELFSFDKNAIANLNENENRTLSKNFNFKFLTNKINGEENDRQKTIQINITNKKTKTIQKLEFTPSYLVVEFDGNSSNCSSYFNTKKTIIKSYQPVEGGQMFIVLDINFDGLEDFAIINHQGGNGGPQYAFYVQNANKQFTFDSYLTDIVRFIPEEINNNTKTIKISHPSGCCNIQIYKFQIQPNGQWKEIYSKLEDL